MLRRISNSLPQFQLETLAAVQSARKEIELGPKPGQRIRSGVVPLRRSGPAEEPPATVAEAGITDLEPNLKDKSLRKTLLSGKMIDLDSDGEL